VKPKSPKPADFEEFARQAFRYDKPPHCLITPWGNVMWGKDGPEVHDPETRERLALWDEQEALTQIREHIGRATAHGGG
jgi:hypothetical protein